MRSRPDRNTDCARAIRRLLAEPLLLRRNDEELFRTIAIERAHLTAWFEDNLGWRLQVDIRSGVARLHKRAGRPDRHRGLARRRSTQRPFDVMRYQLLAVTCSRLLGRPLTTLGDLADAIARVCNADDSLLPVDMTRHAHRCAFVDALLWLLDIGVIEVRAGDLEGYGDSEDVDAVLHADTALFPLLLSSDAAPSRVGATTPEEWIAAMTAEPRYGSAATDPENTDRDQRARWARHQAIRALLDDPAVDLGGLAPAVRDYLGTPAGREKVLAAVSAAGLRLERHGDVWLALDPTGESSHASFGSSGRASTVQQAAAVVLAALFSGEPGHERRPIRRSREALAGALQKSMDENRQWARTYRRADGAAVLLDQAVDLLEEFGLATSEGEYVTARPAAGRFAVTVSAASQAQGGDRTAEARE
jgi:uncharacterized protein (TIGR02678 family)